MPHQPLRRLGFLTETSAASAGRTVAEHAASLKTRPVMVYAILAALNIGAWVWTLVAFRGEPTLLGIALLVYGLGLRHAVDADHIAAIDNVTRKLMQDGKRPVSVGFFFAIGHSTVVVIVAAAVGTTANLLGSFQGLQDVGGTVSTCVSALFLIAIAATNLAIFASVYRSYRRIRAGEVYLEEDLDVLLGNRGLLSRIFRPLLRLVPRHRGIDRLTVPRLQRG